MPAFFRRLFGGGTAQGLKAAPTSVPQGFVEVQRRFTRLAGGGRQGVAGEYYHRADIARFVDRRRIASVGDWDAGLYTPAFLAREPKNRYDRNAVAVLLPHDGGTVLAGYLPAEVAPSWQPLLQGFERVGRIPVCAASVYRAGDAFQVVLHLSDPQDATFLNAEPDGATFLPADRQCAVTGEKEHQETLARYDRQGPVWATLHGAVVSSGKSAGQRTIEVRIDGAPVGTLTAAQGQRYTELLTFGSVVACEARIFQGANYIEVQLMLPKVG